MSKNFIALTLLLLWLVSCRNTTVEQTEESKHLFLNDSLKTIVSLDMAIMTKVSNELILNGRVTFNPEKVAHVYPIFGGTITDINIELGDYVRKGDVLAVIRSSEVADYDKQKKEVAQQLVIARRNLEATEDMFRSGMSSERDLLQARQSLLEIEAEQKRLDEIYSIYSLTNNSTYQVKSPVSGFVVSKNVNSNMQIRSDQSDEIFTISGLDDVWIMADVYEGDISKVKEGASVRITTLAYDDKEFFGEIDKVYNMLNDASKTMNVRVKLKNDNYMLKPGMFTNVYVQCKVEGQTMLRINSHAVIFEDGKNYIVRVSKDGLLEMKEISVFKQTEKYCYIDSGLEEGNIIIDNNALLIYNALK
ncbi:efflux RND transporter periplasmic adaptor subunit [Parabacteroides bouchesdurhonensis]|uniref:efflux RND transporter periplasmic adaptor subunit n=1 Tax=Parabacteroides bouchesdurhonensis TaxID=1936995 RepID=UPI000E4DE98B|nr:efflux RND transporter periplasmic adaptor subunit [Parabacteroides bouchesdurhonensis]RHJ91383.1 efflux RND transporter periplasmic adaptor subunit [Bacteroides sp. AM07-16]